MKKEFLDEVDIDEIEAAAKAMGADEFEHFVIENFGDKIVESIESVRGSYMVNPEKQEQIRLSALLLLAELEEQDAKVKIALCQPFKQNGYVSVEGKDLRFSNHKWFKKIVELFDTFEAYPLLDHRVRITFGFNDVLIPIEKEGK